MTHPSSATTGSPPVPEGKAGLLYWLKPSAQSSPSDTLLLQDIRTPFPANSLVLSWNAICPPKSSLTFEIRAVYADTKSPFYSMGTWTSEAGAPARASKKDQKDGFGQVLTDTLLLTQPTDRFEIRVTAEGAAVAESLKSLYLSFVDTRGEVEAPRIQGGMVARGGGSPRNSSSSATLLLVPQRCQGDYPNGSVICSPTATSMILAYWANKLKRPELDEGVEKVCKAVYDPNWPGTGNWPFNTAYAGSFPGMRGAVARLRSSAVLEQLIARGIPIACSVSYDLLKGKDKRGKNDGHLVVCVGFTKDGDPIFNDPGKRAVRQTYDRWAFERAWAASNRTSYVIFPESHDSVFGLIGDRYSGP